MRDPGPRSRPQEQPSEGEQAADVIVQRPGVGLQHRRIVMGQRLMQDLGGGGRGVQSEGQSIGIEGIRGSRRVAHDHEGRPGEGLDGKPDGQLQGDEIPAAFTQEPTVGEGIGTSFEECTQMAARSSSGCGRHAEPDCDGPVTEGGDPPVRREMFAVDIGDVGCRLDPGVLMAFALPVSMTQQGHGPLGTAPSAQGAPEGTSSAIGDDEIATAYVDAIAIGRAGFHPAYETPLHQRFDGLGSVADLGACISGGGSQRPLDGAALGGSAVRNAGLARWPRHFESAASRTPPHPLVALPSSFAGIDSQIGQSRERSRSQDLGDQSGVTGSIPSFEHDHAMAVMGQTPGCCASGGTRADDDDVIVRVGVARIGHLVVGTPGGALVISGVRRHREAPWTPDGSGGQQDRGAGVGSDPVEHVEGGRLGFELDPLRSVGGAPFLVLRRPFLAGRIGSRERVALMADHGKNLVFGQLAAKAGHRGTVVGECSMSSPFTVGVSIGLYLGGDITLGTHVDEVEHVFDTGERRQYLALPQRTTSASLTVDGMTARALVVDHSTNTDGPFDDFFGLGHREEVQERPHREQAQRGHCPEWDLASGLGRHHVGGIGLGGRSCLGLGGRCRSLGCRRGRCGRLDCCTRCGLARRVAAPRGGTPLAGTLEEVFGNLGHDRPFRARKVSWVTAPT